MKTDSLTTLDTMIIELVFQRCEPLDHAKCPAGNLSVWLWHSMGGKGEPPGEFHRRVQSVMAAIGYRYTIDCGHRCFRGLRFKGEACTCPKNYKRGCACYRNPKAQDLPKWINQRVHFRYVLDDGRITIHKPDTTGFEKVDVTAYIQRLQDKIASVGGRNYDDAIYLPLRDDDDSSCN